MPKLSPLESEFASSEEAEAHDRWFHAKVEAALASTGAKIPHDEAMVKVRAVTAGRHPRA